MNEDLLQGFWLGNLHIEPANGTVIGDGVRRHLPSRAVEVLLRLAHEPGEVVAREDLLADIWGAEGGTKEALNHAIHELRVGLGDEAGAPRFIQTVPRRGYRLLQSPTPVRREDSSSVPLLDQSIWQELMHRGVVQAAALYLVVGWLLIQVAGETFLNLGLPAWSVPFVTYVVVAGFPLVLLLAWFLEFAEGRLTIDLGGNRSRERGSLLRNYLAAVAAFAVAGVGVSTYQISVGIRVPETTGTPAISHMQPADLPVEPNSIAVLRFENIGNHQRARVFSDGLAEDVLDRLARVPGLLVASRTDAWSLPVRVSSAEVRRRLRVANYLEGSVRLNGDVLRVTIQLIDSETGFHKLSRTFTRQLDEFMQVQQEITDLTVANLRIAIDDTATLWQFEGFVEADIDAYVLYRLGREILQAPQTVASLHEAIRHFEQALALDEHYAAAHAGLCRAHVELFRSGSETERIEMAERACADALLSNPNLSMVYTALGDLYQATNRLDSAELAYRNALERNRKDVDAMSGLAAVLYAQQRIDEAETQFIRAMEVQPGNWRTVNALGSFYFWTGSYTRAAEAYRKVVFLDPENWQTLGNLGSARIMTGDFEAAEDALTRALEIQPTRDSYSNLGIVYYYLGQFPEAVSMHRQAIQLAPRWNIAWLNLGDALHFNGEEGLAREAFEQAAQLSEERLVVNSGESESIEVLAFALAMLGKTEDALRNIERAVALVPNDPYAHYYHALILNHAGDTDGALAAIDRAVRAGYSVTMLRAEPYLANLRNDHRFLADAGSEQDQGGRR